MDWKLGEIRKVDGEWYQCVEGNYCGNCSFNGRKCFTIVDNGDPIGNCFYERRKDNKEVIFKKLTKYMHPFCMDGHKFQLYLLPEPVTTPPSESEEIKLVRWDIVQIMETI